MTSLLERITTRSKQLRDIAGTKRAQLRIPASWPHRWALASLGFGRLPDWIIIGAQRSGSKSLYRYLTAHPHVLASRRGEVHYFDLNFDRSIAWYESYFPLQFRQRSELSAGEKSPYYLFHPLVPERLARVLPDGRLIALLRNPVERAYSHYTSNVMLGIEKRSFATSLDEEPEMIRGETSRILETGEPSHRHRHLSYTSRGLYADQLSRWMREFPASQLMVIKSETLFAHPAETVARVCAFLEIDRAPASAWQRRNETRELAPLDPAIRNRLRTFFEEPNQRLHELTGIEVDDWV